MHKILGIDLGASAVKAVAIEASFRSHQLRAYRSEPVAPAVEPPEGEAAKSWAERAQVALEALARDDWFRADTIICCLPAAQVATHLVTLPFGDAKRVEQTLPFEIEGIIPFDLDEVVFDAHVLARAPNKTDLLVAVARRPDIESTLAMLKAVGVDPAIVTFSALALANLHAENYLGPAAPGADGSATPLEAVVDVGAERTNILLMQDGQVRAARTVAVAGGEVTRALSRSLSVCVEAAESVKRNIVLGGEGDPGVMTAVERAVSMLVRDLRSTFASHQTRSHQKVERIHLCGGGARLGGLAGFIESALGVPVEMLALAPGRDFPEPEELLPGALALALALRGTGNSRSPRLNFRKGAFASTQTEGAWRDRVGALVAMAAVLLVLFGVSTFARLNALETREKRIDDALCDATKKILGNCETDFRVALGKLKGKGSPAASVPPVSAVDLASSISDVFPSGDDAILSDLDIVDTTVSLRGDAKSYEAVDRLVEGIQKNKCFSEIRKGNLTKSKTDRIEFKLDALYGCGIVKKAGS